MLAVVSMGNRRRGLAWPEWVAVCLTLLGSPLAAQNLGLEPQGDPPGNPGPECSDGVVLDDGTLETGYGWVPSVVDGRYVQTFRRNAFPSNHLETVCVCWTRTTDDQEIAFRVEIYRDTGGAPELVPLASVPALATGVPEFPDGAFVEVDLSGHQISIPGPIAHIGVSWNPSRDQFFFVCADHSPETERVDGHFIDDRAKGWESVLVSRDPIFRNHRAMLIRARALPPPVGPVLGPLALVALGWILAVAGRLRL